jgi:hypothetical protein
MRIVATLTAVVTTMLLTASLPLLSKPTIYKDLLAQGQVGQQQAGNVPPVANTSQDQIVNEGDLVILNGSGSFDPDGEIVSYGWGIEDSDDEAPPVSLNGQNTSIATFTAPMVAGTVNANSYLFELTVTDNNGLKGTNTSKVVVEKGAATQ